MSLYSRKDYERDLAAIEAAEGLISCLVANKQITGFQALQFQREADAERRAAKAKLARTRQILAGNNKSTCEVPGHFRGCVCQKNKKYFGEDEG